jgi:hypothetical protein
MTTFPRISLRAVSAERIQIQAPSVPILDLVAGRSYIDNPRPKTENRPPHLVRPPAVKGLGEVRRGQSPLWLYLYKAINCVCSDV